MSAMSERAGQSVLEMELLGFRVWWVLGRVGIVEWTLEEEVAGILGGGGAVGAACGGVGCGHQGSGGCGGPWPPGLTWWRLRAECSTYVDLLPCLPEVS